jgi:pimeloyl-ACP methyl ester carboxylesterase
MSRYLLLHAFPFDGSMWDPVAARLRAEGHEVLTPSLRGFDGAPLRDARPDIGVLVSDMVALLGEEPTVVVGCSMGGYVALGMARRRPDLVAALCLVDTKATADAEPAREHRLRVAAMAEEGEDWSAGMIEGLLGETTRRTRSHVVTEVESALQRAPRVTVAWAQRAMAARPDAREALGLLTAPVAVIWGEEDTMSPMHEQELMLTAAPHAQLVRVPAAGHLTPLEAPDAVADVLLAHVAGRMGPL